MEAALSAAVLLTAMAALVLGRGRGTLIALPCVLLALLGWAAWQPGGDSVLAAALPDKRSDGGFVGSDTCRGCHPGPYAAWYRSFHRTMTQPATTGSVLGHFDEVELESRGQRTLLERRGDEFWAKMPDPAWFSDPSPSKPAQPPRIEARVVMTTGSHHLQNYWVRRPTSGSFHANPDNGALVQVPWVWIIDDARWIPAQDSFLTPPSASLEPPLVWNSSCNACHSVASEPRWKDDRFATNAAELGVGCEACHGPAREHVSANQSPLRRYGLHLAGNDEGDPTTVQPARLDKRRSATVCGQCHSFSAPVDMEAFKTFGTEFRAGDDLSQSMAVFRFTENPQDPLLLGQLAREPNALTGRFWPDGTIRVAGREYSGLVESACFQRGELTCLSCHSMHDYQRPADQIARDRSGDAACLDCHSSNRYRTEAHSHHAPDSAGSRCENCHMPHTTYGLFSAIRSHRIDSPNQRVGIESGRPNACNLCHLDQTLEWTGRWLAQWYDQAEVPLSPEQRSVAASMLWALEGDAAQRAIVAWHMGWQPAQKASGRGWLGVPLGILLADPYAVIRRVAERSLRTLPGFDDFAFEFDAPPERIAQSQHEAATRWRKSLADGPDRSGPHLLIDDRGNVDHVSLQRHLGRRNQRPLRIIE